MEILRFSVETEQRLDVFLAEKTQKTRSAIKKLCDEGKVTIDGKTAKKAGENVKVGSLIEVEIPDAVKLSTEAENIPIDIVYQDQDIAVINKPQGLTVHTGNGVHGSTLVNALLYHLDSLSGINGVLRPGIVHRIDKDTSGLLVVAKNDKAHLSLSEQIKDKTCARIYVALLEGVLKNDRGTIDTFIGRSTKNRTMMAVTNDGRQAITHYEVIKRYGAYTLCRFKLQTGRTHQIRVHSKHLGHPIVGDPVYNTKVDKFGLKGQLLHAERLELTHPTTGERMCFTAPMPDYFVSVINLLEKKTK
ncbi:MAG: RluA family pseudouridine synthase [Clostridia bacterium]|nr:RluA family pseudouridine synthase [Clostridia bacterium]